MESRFDRRELLFQPRGIPPLGTSLSLALQHLVAMIVGCVTPPIIIAGAIGLSQEEQVLLIQASLVMSAVCTFLQLYPIGVRFGSGLPVILGVSFAYVPSMQAIAASGGTAIPTVKPWNLETIRQKMDLVKAADPFAIAMDIDAAGLPFLKNMTPPAGSKTVEELREIVAMAEKPFIVKGIMTVAGAKKALEAGAKGIVVSNHGGRVLDQCPSTAEVLPAIVDAVGGRMTILVDGGIRTGMDVFKALALGADAVLIGRPFVTMVYGAGAEGVKTYVEKLKAELADTMAMCGAHSLADISRSMLYGF